MRMRFLPRETSFFDYFEQHIALTREACAELVATWFQQRGRDLSLHREDTAHTYSYWADSQTQLPRRIQALLRPYRNHRVHDNQG